MDSPLVIITGAGASVNLGREGKKLPQMGGRSRTVSRTCNSVFPIRVAIPYTNMSSGFSRPNWRAGGSRAPCLSRCTNCSDWIRSTPLQPRQRMNGSWAFFSRLNRKPHVVPMDFGPELALDRSRLDAIIAGTTPDHSVSETRLEKVAKP